MLGANLGGGNLGGNQGPNQDKPIGGTSLGMATNPPLLCYIDGLRLLDLIHLINNPFFHDYNWPPMPTKLPTDIPKFEGNLGEDPTNHILSLHMWCSSSSVI